MFSGSTAVLFGNWKFDKGAGETAGDSADSNTGTLTGMDTATAWVESPWGTALDFDGVDNYVSVPDDSTLDVSRGLTLAAWTNRDNPAGDGSAISKPSGGTGYRLASGLQANLGLNNGVFNCSVGGSQDLPANEWSHIAGTYDGSTMKVYVNGQLDVTNTTCASGSWLNSLEPLQIGREFEILGG